MIPEPQTTTAAINWIDILLPLTASALVGVVSAWITVKVTLATLVANHKHTEEDVKELKNDVKQLMRDVASCETRLEERGQRPPLTKSKSPITLTEPGLDLLRNSGGQEWVGTNREMLIEEIKERAPASPYDVQEYARQVLAKRAEDKDPTMNGMKDYAYQKGIPLDDILTVTAIFLRDEALPRFGYKVGDLPNKMGPMPTQPQLIPGSPEGAGTGK